MNLLVTGGAGFIGSHYVHLARARRPNAVVVNLDALTYAGDPESVSDLGSDPNHVFVRGDIRDAGLVRDVIDRHRIDAIVNFAAESHVDRSILTARPFLDTNVLGTLRLLEAAHAAGVRRFVQISTDEVYGSLGPTGAFDETSPLAPRSPYSASKVAADAFVMAFHHTHGLDVGIVRPANNYGPRQFPEKLIPLATLNALEGQPIPIYGDGLQVRDWIHVEDTCDAIDLVLQQGRPGEVYNVGGGGEMTNLELVSHILSLTGRDPSLLRHVTDRPGHDRRYATNAAKIQRELGWRPRHELGTGLRDTIAWYAAHRPWCDRIRTGAYREYYDTQYGARLREPAKPGR